MGERKYRARIFKSSTHHSNATLRQIFDAVGWGNFDRPQGEPPGPTEKRRREEKKRREEEEEGRGEDYVNIGYACLALMNMCYYLII